MRSLGPRDFVNNANDYGPNGRFAAQDLAHAAAFTQDQNLLSNPYPDRVHSQNIFSGFTANHQQGLPVIAWVMLIGDD
jgi:hypothetical protein